MKDKNEKAAKGNRPPSPVIDYVTPIERMKFNLAANARQQASAPKLIGESLRLI